jgi:hypothetical protein
VKGSEQVLNDTDYRGTKLINVTTNGLQNLTNRNLGLLNMMQDIVYGTCPNQEIWNFLCQCIIHQEVPCKTFENMNHFTSTVVKFANFIRARGLNHKYYLSW